MKRKLWQRIALVVLLAVGIEAIWGGLGIWIVGIMESNQLRDREQKNLVVCSDAEVYITADNFTDLTSKTRWSRLDGTPLENEPGGVSLSGARLGIPESQESTAYQQWSNRVAAIVTTPDNITWFRIHNGEGASGRLYLVGYERRTNTRVGYFSKQGFTVDNPAAEEQFEFDGRMLVDYPGGYTISDGRNMYGGFPVYGGGTYSLGEGNRPVRMRLPTAEGMVEINLTERTVRTLDDSGAYSVAAACEIPVQQLVPDLSQLDGETIDAEFPGALDAGERLEGFVRMNTKDATAARQANRVVVWPARGDGRFEFTLPEEARTRPLVFYVISPTEAVVELPDASIRSRDSKLLWIDNQGKVRRTEELHIPLPLDYAPSTPFAIIGLIVPASIAFFSITLLVANVDPYFLVGGPETTYFARLAHVWGDGWLPGGMLFFACGLMAWAVYARHRRSGLAHAGWWSGLVFCLGLPGLLAYWIENRTPVVADCTACGRESPRNRDDCTWCGQEFPAPGTEVFA